MIYELKSTEFNKVEHLLVSDLINLEIKAVVQGYNPGWVFVDDIEKPRTAMIWSRGIKGFYFVGDENNLSFNNFIDAFIDKEISSRLRNQGINYFEFSGTSLEWNQTFEQIFKNRKMYKSKQFVYKHSLQRQEDIKDIEMDSDYSIKAINRDLFNSNIENLDFLKSTILEWWSSIDDFLNSGVGFCILNNEKVVSICTSSFVTSDVMESHIVTQEEFRKRGLAKKAVSEFLRYCKDKGYEVYWDCMETNTGSRALAESLGYEKDFEYALYEFKLS